MDKETMFNALELILGYESGWNLILRRTMLDIWEDLPLDTLNEWELQFIAIRGYRQFVGQHWRGGEILLAKQGGPWCKQHDMILEVNNKNGVIDRALWKERLNYDPD